MHTYIYICMHVCKYMSLSMVVIVIVVVVVDDDDDDDDDDACVENFHRAIWSCVKHCNRMNPSC